MKMHQMLGSLLAACVILLSGCSVSIQDGMRVTDTSSTVSPFGYVTAPPVAGDKIYIEARNATTGAWHTIKDNIAIDTTVDYTTSDGSKLYMWSADAITIPASDWYSGTGGSYARIRPQWKTGSNVYTVMIPRADWGECFWENFNGQGNTVNYMMSNCFTHRGEAYVYTAGYREGSPTCPAPAASLPKTSGHYQITQVPTCAASIISNHMREIINESTILMHYEISHDAANSASQNTNPDDAMHMCSMQPGSDGKCSLGGFFGGHERYVQFMKRHVMVYDYPWMPQGNIPAWNGSSTIPVDFRNAQVSPKGNCDSDMAGCDGWNSTPITNINPNSVKPAGIYAGSVCSYASVDAVAAAAMNWHNNGHTFTGGHFAVFDSPANPLFFLWHNAINDVWRDYKACPH